MPSRIVTLRIPDHLFRRLEEDARARGMKRSAYIVYLLSMVYRTGILEQIEGWVPDGYFEDPEEARLRDLTRHLAETYQPGEPIELKEALSVVKNLIAVTSDRQAYRYISALIKRDVLKFRPDGSLFYTGRRAGPEVGSPDSGAPGPDHLP